MHQTGRGPRRHFRRPCGHPGAPCADWRKSCAPRGAQALTAAEEPLPPLAGQFAAQVTSGPPVMSPRPWDTTWTRGARFRPLRAGEEFSCARIQAQGCRSRRGASIHSPPSMLPGPEGSMTWASPGSPDVPIGKCLRGDMWMDLAQQAIANSRSSAVALPSIESCVSRPSDRITSLSPARFESRERDPFSIGSAT